MLCTVNCSHLSHNVHCHFQVPELRATADFRMRGDARRAVPGMGSGVGARLPRPPRHHRLDPRTARPQCAHPSRAALRPPLRAVLHNGLPLWAARIRSGQVLPIALVSSVRIREELLYPNQN
jgi:hypothetical protein